MKQVRVKTEGKYFSHNVKANKSINLVFVLPYSELANYIQSIQMLNENVEVIARVGADKPFKLGVFMIQRINIDNDGEGKITFNSLLDHIDSSKLNELAARNDEPLQMMFKADIDVSELEENEE